MPNYSQGQEGLAMWLSWHRWGLSSIFSISFCDCWRQKVVDLEMFL